MTFGEALEECKRGKKIQRDGWNGKGQYVQLALDITYKTPGTGDDIFVLHQDIGSQALAFVGTRGVQIGWLASQSDMLSNDWKVVED